MDSSVGSQYNTCYFNSEGDGGQWNRSGNLNRSIGGLKPRMADSTIYGPSQGPAIQTVAPLRQNENITSWFYGILASRQYVANRALFILSAYIFFAAALIARLDFWKPFDSFLGEFVLILNWKFWCAILLGAALFGFAYGYYSLTYLFNPSNETNSSIDKPGFWRTLGSFFGAYLFGILCTPIVISYSPSWVSNMTTFFFILTSVTVTSTKIALENTFRYDFSARTKTGPGWIHVFKFCLNGCLDNGRQTVFRTATTLQYSFGISFVLALLIGGLRQNIFYLLDPVLLIQSAAFIFGFYVLADLICFSANTIVADGIEFPMPTPFFFSEAKETIVNLVNGMNSKDLLVRQFAFHDFYMKSQGQNKALFFTLSQPGNHPRLWDSIVKQCEFVIDAVATSYTKETQFALSKNWTHGSRIPYELSGGKLKSTLLVPPTLKPRQATAKQNPLFINVEPLKMVIKPYLDRILSLFFSPRHIVPTSDTELALNAVAGLANLIEASYTMDRYGIAQRTLPSIISCYIQLASSCDQLIRARFMRRQNANPVEIRIFNTKDAVVASLTDIYTAFESHISDLKLSDDQLGLLKEYVKH
ncbi:hypothetical protein FO519_005590 [Halicephalobus sp. NKZ332]|nr:hypothetical protein FO519_005590 [Halicephalobus sp. NKZ332]